MIDYSPFWNTLKSSSESTYTLNILGETDSTETGNGGNANNG